MSASSPTGRGGSGLLLFIGFIDSIGSALYLAGGVLFFTHVVGLSTAQVGIGLSAGGLVGLVAQAPVGWLADQIGPRRMLIILNIGRAIGFTLYVFARNFPQVLVIAAVLGIGEQTLGPVYQAVVERVANEDGRMALIAKIRVACNVGYTVGGALATVGLSIGTRDAFAAMFLGNALTFLIAAAVLPSVRQSQPPRPDAPGARRGRMRLTALRDGRYVWVAALNSVLTFHMSLLTIAVPLWVVQHTRAPRELVGPLFIVNTALAVAFQVRIARGSSTVPGAGHALLRASAALAACCVLFCLAPRLPGGWAAALLVVAVAAMTFGELYQSAGGWGLSYQLAPETARAEYFSTFSLGTSVQYIAGPAVVTLGVIDHGMAGWLSLAAAFLLAGGLAGPAARAAQRRLPATVTRT